MWDITTGHCLHTLKGSNKHQSAVTSLQFTDNFVVTSSDDGSVKLWDLKTGEFVRNLVNLESGGNGMYVYTSAVYCYGNQFTHHNKSILKRYTMNQKRFLAVGARSISMVHIAPSVLFLIYRSEC